MNPIVTDVLEQLNQTGNVTINMPEDFNFGFDVIDYAAQHNDKIAYIAVNVSGQNEKSDENYEIALQEFKFSDLQQSSNRVANVLRDRGIQRGDFAIVILPRIPAWYNVIIACVKLGVVSMPGTNLLTARDIEYRINKSQASTVIVTPEHVAKIEEIRKSCPSVKHFIVVPPDINPSINPSINPETKQDTNTGQDDWVNLATAMSSSSAVLTANDVGHSRADDMMMAYFTSGTTAHPKLVPRNHSYALAHVVTGSYWLDLNENDIHWTLSDTGWAKAAWGMLFSPWLMNSTMVLFNGTGFDADLHLRLIKRLKVTTFCAPPTIFRMLAQIDLGNYDLSSIRHTVGAGEPLNPEVIKVWEKATGGSIYDGYGQTETINIVANTPANKIKPGSMGLATPGFDVQIVDDDGNRVADDKIGHIALKVTNPPPIGLFDGYYEGLEPRNRADFRHGWYFTGDTATRDADGYIWFVGRADDVISSAGYRISPFEVESALLEHAAVIESAVVGKADELRGHIVKAFVVLAEGIVASDELTKAIQEHVKQATAPYKYPREIEYRDDLPKTISGKIRRVELREQA